MGGADNDRAQPAPPAPLTEARPENTRGHLKLRQECPFVMTKMGYDGVVGSWMAISATVSGQGGIRVRRSKCPVFDADRSLTRSGCRRFLAKE